MTTAREIQLMHEEGLRRWSERWAPVFERLQLRMLDLVDAQLKRYARERYYLRHRLVRLLRRRQRGLAWLQLCAALLGRTLNTPDRKWFSLGDVPVPESWAFRLCTAHGAKSDWHHVGVDLARPSGDVQSAFYTMRNRVFEFVDGAHIEHSQRPDIGRWQSHAESYGLPYYQEATEFTEAQWRYLQKTTSPTPPQAPTGPHGGVSAFPHGPHHPIGGGGGWGWGLGEIPFARTCISLQLAKIFNVGNT